MRIKNSLKNFMAGLGSTLISSILAFVSRTIFINILGEAYLGINGLLTNVLSMLSLAELGIGTAINFSLYKPIAENDEKKISILMNFYKITYRYIGIIVFIVGLIIMLFLDVMINDIGDVQNIKLIYFIYLVNTSYSYLMTYKVTLLNAYQKGYLINSVNIAFNIITVISQILILILTKNYIAYLLTNMILLFIQRVYINFKITNMYPFLKQKVTEKLSKEELSTIIKNVKAMMFHKIGDYCINGTDNIIMSTFISISIVGIYSNYQMIITLVNGVIVMFFNSMTASMGNLIATSLNKRKVEIFNIINFIGFWLFGFSTVCFYNLLNPFIELWLGSKFLISDNILMIILLNYYLTGMRVPVYVVKSASGLYDEDKFTPIIQSIVNLTVSIILVQRWGLAGVFMGTLISSIILPCWQRPYIVCKYALNISSKEYFIKYFKYLFTIIVTAIGISYICENLLLETTIFNFSVRMMICFILPNIIFVLLFRNTKEFKEIIDIVNNILGGKIKWVRKLV